MFRVTGDMGDLKKTPYEIEEEKAAAASAVQIQDLEPARQEANRWRIKLMDAIYDFKADRVPGIMDIYVFMKGGNVYMEEYYHSGKFIDVAADWFRSYPENPELPNEPNIVACRSIVRILLAHISNSHLEEFIYEWEVIARDIRPPPRRGGVRRSLLAEFNDPAELEYDRARMIIAYARHEMSTRHRIDARVFRSM